MFRTSPTQLRRRSASSAPQLEPLESRTHLAAHAVFLRGPGLLAVFGDDSANDISVGRNATGTIVVNGGAVHVFGGTPTVANTRFIRLFGFGGNDQLALDETGGALPKATLFGGAGDDVLTGGSGPDLVFGEAGNDFLIGKGGTDFLAGGAGGDTLTGGADNDLVFGQAGDDHLAWNPGDGSDVNEGGAGNDQVIVNGAAANETFTAAPDGNRVRFDRTDPTPFSLDIGSVETLLLRANSGDDTFTAANGLAPLIHLTIDGGFGNDTLTGSDGADDLLGRDGNDVIDGRGGNDLVLLGDGDDVFTWNPGDGSDTVEGQNGNDRLVFNGAAAAPETIELSANGPRLRLARQAGNVVMDVDGVEQVNVFTGHAANTITVNDLAGTEVTGVSLNIDPNPGDEVGGFPVDRIVVNGSGGADRVQVAGSGHSLSVTGLAATVVVNAVQLNDLLLVNALGGDDVVDASALQSDVVGFALDGGAGNDTLRGSEGGDIIAGRTGSDAVFMGEGDDDFVWNAGDGSDVVEGEAGRDMLSFNGSDDAEVFGVSANGNRVRLSRDLGNVTLDVNDVERLDVSALGGADKVVVNDLTGTDVGEINLSLAAESGGNAGDGQADSIIVNGGADGELIPVLGTDGGIMVNGGFAEAASLQYFMAIRAVEPADMLQVSGNGGNDSIDASGLQTPVKFRAEGGAADDIIRGSAGDDVLLGGDGQDGIDGNGGADSAFLGAGNDIFIWDPGDGSDLVEGQDGADTLVFRGANTLERFDLSANGERLRLTRSPGNIAMDVNDVERVDLIAQGGPDNIFVNDLAGTDVVAVNISLGTGGGPNGDQLADAVSVSGSAGADRIVVTDVAGVAEVIRPTTLVRITGADPEFDTLTVNGLAGNDTIDATGLTPGIIQLGALGGEGDDTLLGGPGEDFFDGGFGNDTLTGGAGDDVLIGGPGVDILDGGTGNNTLIQD
jgi:Ca2+-binding RTX toxin-like protein